MGCEDELLKRDHSRLMGRFVRNVSAVSAIILPAGECYDSAQTLD